MDVCCFKVVLTVCVFVISAATATPVHLIRTGIVKDKSQGHNDDYYAAKKQEGVSLSLADDTIDANNERKFTAAQDSGKYNFEDNNKRQHHDEGLFRDENFHRLNGDSIANVGKKFGHHKGHNKSGFRNTYHKEESGNNSSFYDDSADDGDEYIRDEHKETYDDLGGKRKYGTYSDGAQRFKENAKRGDYDDRSSYVKDNSDRQEINRGKYYDEEYNGGKTNTGQDYGLRGSHHQEEYYQRPTSGGKVFYQNYQPKRTITIYEDPRVLQHDYTDRYYKRSDYDSEPVNLDFRVRPGNAQNYYYNKRRPNYDYDYYYYY